MYGNPKGRGWGWAFSQLTVWVCAILKGMTFLPVSLEKGSMYCIMLDKLSLCKFQNKRLAKYGLCL